MLYLDFFDISKYRSRQAILKDIKNDNKPVAIYGAGQIGKEVAEFLIDNEIDVLCFIETQKYLYPGKTVYVKEHNLACVSVEELKKCSEEYNVLLGIIDSSVLLGLRSVFSYCKYVEYLDVHNSHIIDYDFLVRNKCVIEELYASLQDIESKDVLEAFLHARYTGDVHSISALKQKSNYLYDWGLLQLDSHDVIIDAGAYNGDTVLEIIDYLDGVCPKKIYSFEPDDNNHLNYISNINIYYYNKNIEIIGTGLYCKDTVLRFDNNGTLGASVSENGGGGTIKVCSLDQHEEYWDATLIKMDIEGCELHALKGAKNLIKKNKPKLAICIYHNNMDVIDVYEFLKDFGYKIYLRQHSRSSEETVLYAI